MKNGNEEKTDNQPHFKTACDPAGNGVNRGWREHPDFSSLTDSELAAEEAIINDRIKWAVEDADEERWGWYRDEMQLLNAERTRRNGGVNSYNSYNSYNSF